MDKYKVIVNRIGTKMLYLNSELHCEDGPAIISTNGRYWYLNGKRHRSGGPAAEFQDGAKSWYLNGLRHREDGPAVEDLDGRKWWYFKGEYLTEKQYSIRMSDG